MLLPDPGSSCPTEQLFIKTWRAAGAAASLHQHVQVVQLASRCATQSKEIFQR